MATKKTSTPASSLSAEQNHERLVLSQKAGKLGSFEWLIQDKQIIWTPELEALYGLKPGTFKGTQADWNERIHPEDLAQAKKTLDEAVQGNSEYHVEFRIIRPDGSTRWMLAKGDVYCNEQKKPHRMVGVNIDITDRKVIEANLTYLAEASKILSSSLDYQTTLKNIAELAVPGIADWCAIDMLTNEGKVERIVVAHKDPEKIKWAEELNKKTPVDMNAPTGLPLVLRTGKTEFYPLITDEMLKAATKKKEDYELMKKIGFTAVIIVPLMIQGKARGAITFVSAEAKRPYTESDLAMAEELASRASLAMENARLFGEAQEELTQRRELEQLLRELNEQLDEKVQERTTQLAATNKELLRSNKELQDFAYVASHDLQEPLRKIQSFGNLLEEEYKEVLKDNGRMYLSRIISATGRMRRLIDDILTFSRVTTKAQPFKETDLEKIIKEVLTDLEISIKEVGANITTNHLPTIQADALQMRQLFQNLIGNSLKFHKTGVKPVIHVTGVTEKTHVIITVEDNGVGFDNKYSERIFTLFERLHGRGDYEGTGIGLAVVKKIIDRHNGKIKAKSHIDEGTTFTITLPVKQQMEVNNSKNSKYEARNPKQ